MPDDLDPLERSAINGGPVDSAVAVVNLAYHARQARQERDDARAELERVKARTAEVLHAHSHAILHGEATALEKALSELERVKGERDEAKRHALGADRMAFASRQENARLRERLKRVEAATVALLMAGDAVVNSAEPQLLRNVSAWNVAAQRAQDALTPPAKPEPTEEPAAVRPCGWCGENFQVDQMKHHSVTGYECRSCKPTPSEGTECDADSVQSRTCERGTNGCTVRHSEPEQGGET